MGYTLLLRLNVSKSLCEKITFIKNVLTTAKILDINIKLGEKLMFNKEILIQIQDKGNESFLKDSLFEEFPHMKSGAKKIDEEMLKNFQYFEFMMDTQTFYLCLSTGLKHSYCIANVFPRIDAEVDIENRIQSLDTYYDQEILITFSDRKTYQI